MTNWNDHWRVCPANDCRRRQPGRCQNRFQRSSGYTIYWKYYGHDVIDM